MPLSSRMIQLYHELPLGQKTCIHLHSGLRIKWTYSHPPYDNLQAWRQQWLTLS